MLEILIIKFVLLYCIGILSNYFISFCVLKHTTKVSAYLCFFKKKISVFVSLLRLSLLDFNLILGCSLLSGAIFFHGREVKLVYTIVITLAILIFVLAVFWPNYRYKQKNTQPSVVYVVLYFMLMSLLYYTTVGITLSYSGEISILITNQIIVTVISSMVSHNIRKKNRKIETDIDKKNKLAFHEFITLKNIKI